MNYCVILQNYVINVLIGEEDLVPEVDIPHDFIIKDPTFLAGKGDWYSQEEDIFYRPLKIPLDIPDYLKQ